MSKSPLIFFAFDGADVEFLLQWAREGYLPTFASILERGCCAMTAGPELIAENGTWTTMLSGISHNEHGYYYFRQLRPGTYDLHPIGPSDLNFQPFWAQLRGTQRRVAIIDGPDMLPVSGLNGIQLANWATHQPATAGYMPSSEPPDLLGRVRSIFGPQMSVLEFQPDSTPAEDREEFRRIMARIEKKGALIRELLKKDRYDVTLLGFFEAHTAGHRFWKYRPESSQSRRWPDATDLSHAIRDIYQAVDKQMGLLLQQLPADANVIIATAFSMEDTYPTHALTDEFCRQLGYWATPQATTPTNGSSRSFSPIALLRRALPERWRVAISNRLPTAMQERLLADQFRSTTDWSKTTAFAIPGLYTGFIRVNLKGREPQGIVEPGAEYFALLDRLEADLRQLVDPVDGAPAVQRITRTCGTLSPDAPQALPDLFIDWRPADYFLERVIHPRAELVQRTKLRYHRDTYHSFDGLLACAGPDIRARGMIGEISLLDVAPTLLSLIGQPPAPWMSGHSVVEKFSGDGARDASLSGGPLADPARH